MNGRWPLDLVLLCHGRRIRKDIRGGARQHGHRLRVLARGTVSLRRMVAIEFGHVPFRTGRWQGRVVHAGKRQTAGLRGLRAIQRGKSSPLTDQEAVGGAGQRGMMVEALSSIVAEADLLFQILMVTLDMPTEAWL